MRASAPALRLTVRCACSLRPARPAPVPRARSAAPDGETEVSAQVLYWQRRCLRAERQLEELKTAVAANAAAAAAATVAVERESAPESVEQRAASTRPVAPLFARKTTNFLSLERSSEDSSEVAVHRVVDNSTMCGATRPPAGLFCLTRRT